MKQQSSQTIDRLRSSIDPRLLELQKLKNPNSNVPKAKNLQACSLLKSACSYVKEKLEASPPTIADLSEIQDDTQTVYSIAITNKTNTNMLRSRKGNPSQARNRQYDNTSQLKLSKLGHPNVKKSAQNEFEGIILQQNYLEQPQVILQYLVLKDPQKYVLSGFEKEIVNSWKYCLSREDRMEVQREKTCFANPRNIELRHITAGLSEIYGTGTRRRLRPGQEATIIQTIQRYLNSCSKTPSQIALKESTIYETILSWAELEELSKYPFCMKQLEYHFKIMATRWRYSGKLDMLDKQLERALATAQNRGHFIDLTKSDDILTKYLLKYSHPSGEDDQVQHQKNRGRMTSRFDPSNTSFISDITKR